MIEDLIDIIDSLTLIMDEETVRLAGRDYYKQSGTTVEAKLRLVAALEVSAVQLMQKGVIWAEDPGHETLERLQTGLTTLNAAADRNCIIIARQIDLSAEMMA